MPGQPQQPQQEHQGIKLREMMPPSGLAVASPLPPCVLPARLHADRRLWAPLRMCHRCRLTLVVASGSTNRFIQSLLVGRVKPEMSFRPIAQLRPLEHIRIKHTNRHDRFQFEARRCMISLQHWCRCNIFLGQPRPLRQICSFSVCWNQVAIKHQCGYGSTIKAHNNHLLIVINP